MLFSTSLFLMGKLGHLTWFIPLSVQYFPMSRLWYGCQCGIFECVRRCWSDTTNCDSGLYRHHKRICTGRWLGEKHPLLHLGLEPKSVLHLAFIQMLHQLLLFYLQWIDFNRTGSVSDRVTPDAGTIYPVNTAGLSDDWSHDWWK